MDFVNTLLIAMSPVMAFASGYFFNLLLDAMRGVTAHQTEKHFIYVFEVCTIFTGVASIIFVWLGAGANITFK